MFFFLSFYKEVLGKLCKRSRVKSLILGGIVLYFIGLQFGSVPVEWLVGGWTKGRSVESCYSRVGLHFFRSLKVSSFDGVYLNDTNRTFSASYLDGYLV